MPFKRKRPVIDFSLGQVIRIPLASFSLTPEVISSYTYQLKKAFQSIQSLGPTLCWGEGNSTEVLVPSCYF